MQKTILTGIFILIGIINSIGQETHTITLDFEGIEVDKGSLYVAVYNTEKKFLKEPIRGTIVKVIDKKATVSLEDFTTGIYAISAFHDINDNKKMDTNFIGIPKEPIGISNNAKGFMGPPKYKDAKFDLKKNIKLIITMK